MKKNLRCSMTLAVIPIALSVLLGVHTCGEPYMNEGFTGTFLTQKVWGDTVWDQMEAYYDLFQYADGDLICWFTDWEFDDYELEQDHCWGSWEGDQFEFTVSLYYPCAGGMPCYCSDDVYGQGVDTNGDGYYDTLEGVAIGDCPDGVWDKEALFTGQRQVPPWEE